MKLVDKIRVLTKKGIDRNMKVEYKNAKNEIKIASSSGRYTTTFNINPCYENKDDIYMYVMDNLKKEGFIVEIEHYGFKLSWKRLKIDWNNA